MKTLKAKRALVKGSLTRIVNYINETPTATLPDWDHRYERLKEITADYLHIMNAMVEKCDGDEADMVEIEADFAEFEERVVKARADVRARLIECAPSTASNAAEEIPNSSFTELLMSQTQLLGNISANITSNNNLLPKLKIKSFSGDLTEWKGFHDLYESAIHNNPNYTKCQKFQLLKGYLTDRAYEIIARIPETNENYDEAWRKLCTRYNKLGVIAHTYIGRFLDLPTIPKQSAPLLRDIYDNADEILSGLKALGNSAESRDIWLIHILLKKLDANTTQEWSKFTKSNTDFPSFKEFMAFLDTTCIALESTISTTTARGSSKPTVRAYNATMVKSKECTMCKEDHELFQCPQFKNLNIRQRKEFVGSKRICYNCLKLGHLSRDCFSRSTCHSCQRKHHTLLHDANGGSNEENQMTTSSEDVS